MPCNLSEDKILALETLVFLMHLLSGEILGTFVEESALVVRLTVFLMAIRVAM